MSSQNSKDNSRKENLKKAFLRADYIEDIYAPTFDENDYGQRIKRFLEHKKYILKNFAEKKLEELNQRFFEEKPRTVEEKNAIVNEITKEIEFQINLEIDEIKTFFEDKQCSVNRKFLMANNGYFSNKTFTIIADEGFEVLPNNLRFYLPYQVSNYLGVGKKIFPRNRVKVICNVLKDLKPTFEHKIYY